MKKVLLDTNFILIPAQFKVDIYSEIQRLINEPYELYVLDKSLIELENLIKSAKGQNKAKARLAKAILDSKLNLGKAKLIPLRGKPKVLKTTSKNYVDRIILGLKGYIVATQDSILRKNLKKQGKQTIVLRKKQYLMLD